jgi:nucleoside 2-deoxyribosyltransferase
MSRVFISYSNEDREFARWIRGALTQAGIATNSDDVELSPGADFSSAIRNAIKTADALVVILSDKAISSHNLGFEIGMAAGLGKKVVAVLAPGMKPDTPLLRSIADDYIPDAAKLEQTAVGAEIRKVLQKGQKEAEQQTY